MRNSFEGPQLERIDIERIHEKASAFIEGARIQETEFINPYGEETVARDLKTVEIAERHFEDDRDPYRKELKMIADIFEAVVIQRGELSNWFGQEAVTFKTSKYDDYKNGVDAIIEFRQDEPRSASYLGFAVDVTFNADSTKKLERIKDFIDIDNERLAVVKYFHSEHMNIHGQLSKLPKVIIGAERATVEELAELWIGNKNKALEEHRVQIMILTQMKEQLEVFALYAESMKKTDIARIHREGLAIISKILDSKEELVKKVGNTLNDDAVHFNITRTLARLKSSVVQK